MTMTAEQITKARQLLAKEVNDRKVYADALEAVNALEALQETEKELQKGVDRLTSEKAQIDADCDQAALRLKDLEAKGDEVTQAAQLEAQGIISEAKATADNIIDAAGKEAESVKAALNDVEILLDTRKKELATIEDTISKAQKTLDGFKSRVEGIIGTQVNTEA